MAYQSVVVGIDVSKDTLDVALLPSGEFLQFSNDRSGLRALVSVLRRKKASLVAFEATGGYEKGLLTALTKAKLAELMDTSRAQVDRILKAKGNVTIETLQRAAALVGRKLRLELV